MNIYVGNLSFKATEDDLRQVFSAYGQVASVAIIKDQVTSRSRGFAFVEMPTASEANAAIAGLNGKELQGRVLTINEARPRAERPPRAGGDRGGFGGGSGGGERRGGGGRGGFNRGGGSGGFGNDRQRGSW